MTLTGYKDAQSNRMFLISEGIECLVIKTLHTQLDPTKFNKSTGMPRTPT